MQHCIISLNHGQVALVDAADFEWLNQWKWHARWQPNTHSYYAQRSKKIGRRSLLIFMHREILGLQYGDPRIGDHIEPSQTLDNRRSNLRIADHCQSMFNRRIYKNNSSGFKGVSLCRETGKWMVQIQSRHKRIKIQGFANAEAAGERYAELARELHGEFGRIQ